MKRLLELGILKDASIFGTAFFGIYIAKRMQKAPVYPALSRYPSLLRSPLAQAARNTHRIPYTIAHFLSFVQMGSLSPKCQ